MANSLSVASGVLDQHLLNYPVINDGIHASKSNEYGRRSIKLGDAAYQTFAAPIIPYFSKPYQCVSPYKPTEELYRDTRALILLPYHKGLEGKDHVFQVYSSEAKKNEQAGLVAHGKAAATTVLVVSNETLFWISSFLHQKKAETINTVNEKINQ
ncbi:hypothetical protein NOF04DRAFT_1370692 [Fusarium oxysporum II5]|nr:hypothetical protein NOF04DRAFT_1370692 [Fusarium oxysporum II5]